MLELYQTASIECYSKGKRSPLMLQIDGIAWFRKRKRSCSRDHMPISIKMILYFIFNNMETMEPLKVPRLTMSAGSRKQ